MRYRSKKRETEYADRRVIVERLLRERPACEACKIYAGKDGKVLFNTRTASDVHEIIRRSQGGSILDAKNLLAICRDCHNRIGKSPKEAQQVGLQLPGWATAEMREEAATIRAMWARGEACQPSWLQS